jgi:hypothetical protein
MMHIPQTVQLSHGASSGIYMQASDRSVPLYTEEGEFYGTLPHGMLAPLSLFPFVDPFFLCLPSSLPLFLPLPNPSTFWPFSCTCFAPWYNTIPLRHHIHRLRLTPLTREQKVPCDRQAESMTSRSQEDVWCLKRALKPAHGS